MPFQFYCPQGHLLEGHESQMGQQGQCPMCGAMFVFPMMGGPGAMPGMPGQMPGQMPGAPPGYGQPGFPQAGHPQQPGFPQQGFPQPGFPQQGFPPQGMSPGGFGGFGAKNIGDRFAGIQEAGPTGPAPEAGFASPEPAAPAEPRSFRILCPNGHEVPTPEDMLGMQALCPFCNAQMELTYEASQEFKEAQEREQRIRDAQQSRFWLNASIWGGVIVTLLLVGMVAMIFMK